MKSPSRNAEPGTRNPERGTFISPQRTPRAQRNLGARTLLAADKSIFTAKSAKIAENLIFIQAEKKKDKYIFYRRGAEDAENFWGCVRAFRWKALGLDSLSKSDKIYARLSSQAVNRKPKLEAEKKKDKYIFYRRGAEDAENFIFLRRKQARTELAKEARAFEKSGTIFA